MEKVDGQWVSKGWNELEHRGYIFKAMQRPAISNTEMAQLSEELVGITTANLVMNSCHR